MSKQKPPARAAKARPTFTNSAGDTFNLYPLNPLEEQLIRDQIAADWRAAGRDLPRPPVYQATNAAGETIAIELKSAKDADTEELKAAWAAYQASSSAFESEFSERFMTSCFLCVDADPADYPRWAMRMRALKVPIPDDEWARQEAFCKTWVIRSSDDVAGLVIACMKTIAALDEEAQAAAEAMFRHQVEAAYTAASAGDPGR